MKKVASAKYLIAALALGWLLFTGNISLARVAAVRLDRWSLCLVGVLFLCLACQAARWWCLLRFHGISIPIAKTFRFCWIGNFFQVVLPGGVGGEFARMYYLIRNDPSSRIRGILSVVADRLTGIYLFFLFAAVAFLFLSPEVKTNPFFRYYSLFAVAVVIGVPLMLSLLFSERFRFVLTNKLPYVKPGVADALVHAYRQHIGWVLPALCLSAVANLCLVVGFWCAGACISLPVPFPMVLVNVPLVVVANSLPISPGGIGVGESAAFAVFKQSGYLAGGELMILVRVVISLLRLPGLVFFLGQK
jgi:uncharacterized membrane protein YbhN (UPF0104 family)